MGNPKATGHPFNLQIFHATTPKTSNFKATGHWTPADRVYIPPRTKVFLYSHNVGTLTDQQNHENWF